MRLTTISKFKGWTAKREDHAGFAGADYPSGAKVRQYAKMAEASPGAPMIVGCSAHSCMQVYVAAAAKQAGVQGIIYTAKRALRTEATQYAIDMGAEVNEVRPAYLSVMRARAKERAQQLGTFVRWDAHAALLDAMEQCANVPGSAQRVVVPTGSGLQAGGVLAGLYTAYKAGNRSFTKVVAVCVSNMAGEGAILEAAQRLLTSAPQAAFFPMSTLRDMLRIVRSPMRYDQWNAARLPDGTVLDPYYAAKALEFTREGDCLWVPGVRPLAAMPAECLRVLDAFK